MARGRKPKDFDIAESTDMELKESFQSNPMFGNENTTKLINSLKASSKQFKNLTKEEEREMINKYRDSDPDKLQQLLIMHNIRQVFSMSKKYFKKVGEYDDLVFRGILGLCIAAKRFDPDAGTKFITYATFWIRKYINETFRKEINPSQTNLSLDMSIDSPKDGEGRETLENLIAAHIDPTDYHASIQSPESAINQGICKDVTDNIYRYMKENNKFDNIDQSILNSLAEGNTVKQVSNELGLSVQYVNKRKAFILGSLKNMLAEKYSITKLDDILIPEGTF